MIAGDAQHRFVLYKVPPAAAQDSVWRLGSLLTQDQLNGLPASELRYATRLDRASDTGRCFMPLAHLSDQRGAEHVGEWGVPVVGAVEGFARLPGNTWRVRSSTEVSGDGYFIVNTIDAGLLRAAICVLNDATATLEAHEVLPLEDAFARAAVYSALLEVHVLPVVDDNARRLSVPFYVGPGSRV